MIEESCFQTIILGSMDGIPLPGEVPVPGVDAPIPPPGEIPLPSSYPPLPPPSEDVDVLFQPPSHKDSSLYSPSRVSNTLEILVLIMILFSQVVTSRNHPQ